MTSHESEKQLSEGPICRCTENGSQLGICGCYILTWRLVGRQTRQTGFAFPCKALTSIQVCKEGGSFDLSQGSTAWKELYVGRPSVLTMGRYHAKSDCLIVRFSAA